MTSDENFSSERIFLLMRIFRGFDKENILDIAYIIKVYFLETITRYENDETRISEKMVFETYVLILRKFILS